MFVAPGPIELVTAIIRRRKLALAMGDRSVRHRLLVMRAVGRQLIPYLIERLADGRHVAVAEDRPNASEKRDLFAFDLRHLPRKVARECLRHSQSDGFHGCLSPLRPLCARCWLGGPSRRSDVALNIVAPSVPEFAGKSQGSGFEPPWVGATPAPR
jgi:hypothetical protein